MFIHETKQEPNKKSSNSTIINQKHPDEHRDKTRNMNTNNNRAALERSVIHELLGGGGGLNRFYRALILAQSLLIFETRYK